MSGFSGRFYADRGPVQAAELRDNDDGTVNVAVLSDGNDGSGLSAGLEVKFNVPLGDGETGTFSR